MKAQQTSKEGWRDTWVMGDVNFTQRFLQTEWLLLRSGMGLRVLRKGDYDCGFNFTCMADAFPRRPFVISTVFDVGTISSRGRYRYKTVGNALIVTHKTILA